LIFDRFYKVDSMRSNGSGTGLWLTLAKHILEKLHGFSLKITSTIGTGTQVKICRMPAP
jgi:signal transduction histidine kinase